MLMKPLYRVKLSLLITVLLLVFWGGIDGAFKSDVPKGVFVEWPDYARKNLVDALPVALSFGYPMHPPSAEGTFLFRSFGEEKSTGEIWKLEPESKERETPILAMGDGLVLMAENLGADLNGVVIMMHHVEDPSNTLIESMCAGLDTLEVAPGQILKKGDRLGVIYNAKENGLQWEVRETLGLGVSPGTSDDLTGWISPSAFLVKHGKVK